MGDRESQVMEVTACDRETAQRLLKQHRNDASAAISAYLELSAGTEYSSNAVVPYQDVQTLPLDGQSTFSRPIGPLPQSTALTDGSGFEDNTALAGQRTSAERTSKKRTTPVDLTGEDDDEDLRKAMQASLESESNRQKRQQDYGYNTRLGGKTDEEKDVDMEDLIDSDELDEMYDTPPQALKSHIRKQRPGSSSDAEYVDRTAKDKVIPVINSRYGLRNRDKIQRPDKALESALYTSKQSCSKSSKAKKKTRKKKGEEEEFEDWSCLIDAANEDDEALSRAIEASMQQSTTATRAQTPQIPSQDFESLGAQSIRPPEQPAAIVSSTPNMELFACSLQALYAAPAFRKALLSLQIDDLRFRALHVSFPGMENYWQGISPGGISDFGTSIWSLNGVSGIEEDKAAIEYTMRLVTLFVFLVYTKRPLCVADDVISRPMKSNYAYVMNSSRKPASDILSCNFQSTLEAINTAVECLYKHDNEGLTERKSALQEAFWNYTSTAVTPQSAEPKNQRKPKEQYETCLLQLIHNNVNTSVHKAIYAHLSDDKSLFTSTADTLFLSIGKLGANTMSFGFAATGKKTDELIPFEVEKVLYMDQFMFEKRNGVRLGLDTDQLKDRKIRLEELEKYRKAIAVHQGIETQTLLNSTIQYFETAYSLQDADEIQLTSRREAEDHLKKLLPVLEREIAKTDKLINEEREAIDDERNKIMAEFTSGLQDPQLQQNCYELQAVLVNNDESAWSYVRHEIPRDVSHASHSVTVTSSSSSLWWRICDGQSVKVTEEEVLSDTNNVFFLVYTRRLKDGFEEEEEEDAAMTVNGNEMTSRQGVADNFAEEKDKPNKTMRLDSEMDWWAKSVIAEQIEVDNAAFGRQLANIAASTSTKLMEMEQIETDSIVAANRDSNSPVGVEMTNGDILSEHS